MNHPHARDAWIALDAKLRPFVARRVRRPADVDDVVQEVFLRMQRGLAALRDDERFGPWVYQVARSAIADHHRMRARHPIVEADAADQPVDATSEDDADADAEKQLALYVAPFVSLLPSPYREALTLTELEGLTQKDAAALLGVSLSAMKSRVQRGRQQLRKSIEECCSIAVDARGRVLTCEPRPDGKLPGCRCEGGAPRRSERGASLD